MAIAKIEPTGCVVRKGKIQLRFSFYLEPDDPRYNKHHIQVPVLPKEGYPDKVDEKGIPVNLGNYIGWLEGLPKEWQDNPFHNHFEYVDANITDEQIQALLTERLKEFFSIWVAGRDIMQDWKPKGRVEFKEISVADTKKCEDRIANIKQLQFDVRRDSYGSD